MKNWNVAVAFFVLAVLVVGALAFSLSSLAPFNGSSPTPASTQMPSPTSLTPTISPAPTLNTSTSNGPTIYTYKIVKTYRHDPGAFTEGLVFDNGVLFESTGLSSSLRRVDLESGNVLQKVSLSEEYFGEGLAVVNDSLVQLTWQNNIGFIYDKSTFSLLGNFSYETEGWGLTNDGNRLIMSDGSSKLTFLDPITFQKNGQVIVHDGNTSITNINELEYVNGDIYANIWLQQKIAIVNPQNGDVKGWIDLTGIYQSQSIDDVLNGIAYDSQNNRLFITGKYWPNLYQITITPKT
jgi:glutamine cyclotransferase